MTIFKKFSQDNRPDDRKHVIVKDGDEYVLCAFVNGNFNLLDIWSYGDRVEILGTHIEWCYFSDFVKECLIKNKEQKCSN